MSDSWTEAILWAMISLVVPGISSRKKNIDDANRAAKSREQLQEFKEIAQRENEELVALRNRKLAKLIEYTNNENSARSVINVYGYRQFEDAAGFIREEGNKVYKSVSPHLTQNSVFRFDV